MFVLNLIHIPCWIQICSWNLFLFFNGGIKNQEKSTGCWPNYTTTWVKASQPFSDINIWLCQTSSLDFLTIHKQTSWLNFLTIHKQVKKSFAASFLVSIQNSSRWKGEVCIKWAILFSISAPTETKIFQDEEESTPRNEHLFDQCMSFNENSSNVP